jgi:hypothetical protein
VSAGGVDDDQMGQRVLGHQPRGVVESVSDMLISIILRLKSSSRPCSQGSAARSSGQPRRSAW